MIFIIMHATNKTHQDLSFQQVNKDLDSNNQLINFFYPIIILIACIFVVIYIYLSKFTGTTYSVQSNIVTDYAGAAIVCVLLCSLIVLLIVIYNNWIAPKGEFSLTKAQTDKYLTYIYGSSHNTKQKLINESKNLINQDFDLLKNNLLVMQVQKMLNMIIDEKKQKLLNLTDKNISFNKIYQQTINKLKTHYTDLITQQNKMQIILDTMSQNEDINIILNSIDNPFFFLQNLVNIQNKNSINSEILNQNYWFNNQDKNKIKQPTIQYFIQNMQEYIKNINQLQIQQTSNINIHQDITKTLEKNVTLFQIYYSMLLDADIDQMIKKNNINSDFFSTDLIILNNHYYVKQSNNYVVNKKNIDTTTAILNKFMSYQLLSLQTHNLFDLQISDFQSGLTLPIPIQDGFKSFEELNVQNQNLKTQNLNAQNNDDNINTIINTHLLPSALNGIAQYSRDLRYLALPTENIGAGKIYRYINHNDLTLVPAEQCLKLYFQSNMKRWIILDNNSVSNNIKYIFTQNRVFYNGQYKTLKIDEYNNQTFFQQNQIFQFIDNKTFNKTEALVSIYFLPFTGINYINKAFKTDINNSGISINNGIPTFFNFIIRYYYSNNNNFDFNLLSGGMLVKKSQKNINFNTIVTTHMTNLETNQFGNSDYYSLIQPQINNNYNYYLIIIIRTQHTYPTLLIANQDGYFYTSSGIQITKL